MKRLALLSLVLILILPLALPNVANAAPEHARKLKTVGHQTGFPFRHPLATIKGTIFEVVTYVGAAVDLVERGTAVVHAGVSKVDEAVDKVEDVVKPQALQESQAPPGTKGQ